MRLGVLGIIGDRGAVGGLGLGRTAGLLQRVAVLDPDRRVVGGALKRDMVEPGRELPFPRRASAVGAGDDRRFAASQPKARHRHPQFQAGGWGNSCCEAGGRGAPRRQHELFTRWRQGRNIVSSPAAILSRRTAERGRLVHRQGVEGCPPDLPRGDQRAVHRGEFAFDRDLSR